MAEKIIVIADSITVNELADALHLPVAKLIGKLFENGIVATINQRIDFETASIIVDELGIDATLKQKEEVSSKGFKQHVLSAKAVKRPPIVALMGHVDHGKTTLLDAILGTSTAKGEAGGITQYISAYQTNYKGKTITLLDTPGHEAFASLRQHGAALTDVVVLVVAADDGVKPQTIEAIKFAQEANTKIIVAINKMDKESANPQLVKTQLANDYNLVPEEWGGDTVMIEISAKTHKNIDKLLEMVLLVSDVEELKADYDVPAEGIVIESHLETGRGPVVGLLVQQGKLSPNNYLVVGSTYGKVRTLLDFKNKAVKLAGPSTPVTITGLKELPQFGDSFVVVPNEKEARRIANNMKILNEKKMAVTNVTSADLIKMMNQKDETKEFNVLVKADVQGSLTSVTDSLKLLNTNKEVTINIISESVGNINESDLRLAKDSGAIIYSFNVNMQSSIKRVAIREKVEVRNFKIIYELLNDARASMEDLLSPKVVETEYGSLIIKGIFRTTKNFIIAGGKVTSGKIAPGCFAKISRDKVAIAEAEITSVKIGQEEVKEAKEGEMCGINLKIDKKIKLEIDDRIVAIKRKMVKQSLN